MKKLYILIIVALLVITMFGVASAEEVTSRWCYDADYTYRSATAETKVCGSAPTCDATYHYSSGKKYCTGDWFIEVSYDGDQFGLVYQADDWDRMSFSDSGLSASGLINLNYATSKTKFYIQNIDGKIPNFILGAWDSETTSYGHTSWVGKKGGYLGEDYFSGTYLTVDCFNDDDCSSSQYCDKDSTNHEQWSCVEKECDKDETKCEGNNYYTCDLTDYTWVDKGKTLNKCDVQCLDHVNCNSYDGFVGEQYCDGIVTVQKYDDYNCVGVTCTPPSVNQVFKDIREVKPATVGLCGVECLDNDDCQGIVLGEKICNGFESVQKSENFTCGTNNKCIAVLNTEELGMVIGDCGVTCLEDSDCDDQDTFVSEEYCGGRNVVRDFQDYSCFEYGCVMVEEPVVTTECSDTCFDAKCINRTFFEKVQDFFQKFIWWK